MYLVIVTSVMLDIVVAYLLYRSADCAYVYLSCAVVEITVFPGYSYLVTYHDRRPFDGYQKNHCSEL